MEVTWDTEKFYVDLPVASLTLGSLKRYLSSRTGVAPEHMKLFSHGGLMRDDSAPLSAYQGEIDDDADAGDGQRSGAFHRSGFWSGIFSGLKKNQVPPMRIHMVGSKETRAVVSDRPDLKQPSRQASSPHQNSLPKLSSASGPGIPKPVADQSSVTSEIQKLTEKVIRESSPKVEEYERRISLERNDTPTTAGQVDQTPATPPTDPRPGTKLNEFACLSEMLLQTLLKLDGFNVESEWTEARAARKEGVRAVQNLLDRLDQIKSATIPNSQL